MDGNEAGSELSEGDEDLLRSPSRFNYQPMFCEYLCVSLWLHSIQWTCHWLLKIHSLDSLLCIEILFYSSLFQSGMSYSMGGILCLFYDCSILTAKVNRRGRKGEEKLKEKKDATREEIFPVNISLCSITLTFWLHLQQQPSTRRENKLLLCCSAGMKFNGQQWPREINYNHWRWWWTS